MFMRVSMMVVLAAMACRAEERPLVGVNYFAEWWVLLDEQSMHPEP